MKYHPLQSAARFVLRHELRDIHAASAENDALLVQTSTELVREKNITSALRNAHEHKEILVSTLTDIVYTDTLTRVGTMTWFNVRIEAEESRAVRSNMPYAVLMVDMDSLKLINDTEGHAAGDLALIKLASMLAQNIRPEDTVARKGGDEFVVVLAGATTKMALHKARDLNEKLSASGISVSIGVAGSDVDGRMAVNLIKLADERMFMIKHGKPGRRSRQDPE